MSEKARDERAQMVPLASVCDRLGINRNTGYEWVKSGKFPIPVWRLGRHLKCKRADVDAYFAASVA